MKTEAPPWRSCMENFFDIGGPTMGTLEQCQQTYDVRQEPLRNDYAPLTLIIDGTSLYIEKLADGTVFLYKGRSIMDKFSSVEEAVEAAEGML